MTNTKTEWVVQRKMLKGHWFDWATKESKQDAIDSLFESLEQEPKRKFQIIVRTTTIEERVIG